MQHLFEDPLNSGEYLNKTDIKLLNLDARRHISAISKPMMRAPEIRHASSFALVVGIFCIVTGCMLLDQHRPECAAQLSKKPYFNNSELRPYFLTACSVGADRGEDKSQVEEAYAAAFCRPEIEKTLSAVQDDNPSVANQLKEREIDLLDACQTGFFVTYPLAG